MVAGGQDLTALMCEARRGDARAYRQLLAALLPWLRAFVRRTIVASGLAADEIEDVVQETLLAIHLKRHTWDERQPFEPWARAVARHKVIDHLRRRGRTSWVNIDDVISSLEMSAGRVAEAAPSDARDLLRQLQGRQRSIVEAISIEGLSAKETGQRLGMSEGAVRVALHRALRFLAALHREQSRED